MVFQNKIRFGPDGVHLFQRDTGLNFLLDEISIPIEKWSKAPRQISIALTNQCNLSCIHCYAPKEVAELDFELLKKWLLELDKNGCFGVGFGGGEPTLYRYFAELCQFGAKETGLAITFTTHGHNFSAKLIKKLKGSVHFIRVSMDGVGSNYELIRGKSFNQFLESLTLLKGEIPFGINFVVNKKTINDLNPAIEVCESYGATELLLLPEVCSGLGKGIDDASLTHLKKWVKGYKGSIKLSISEAFKGDFQFIEPCVNEHELQSYAHIDANAVLKINSFNNFGISIDNKKIIEAVQSLTALKKEIKQ